MRWEVFESGDRKTEETRRTRKKTEEEEEKEVKIGQNHVARRNYK